MARLFAASAATMMLMMASAPSRAAPDEACEAARAVQSKAEAAARAAEKAAAAAEKTAEAFRKKVRAAQFALGVQRDLIKRRRARLTEEVAAVGEADKAVTAAQTTLRSHAGTRQVNEDLARLAAAQELANKARAKVAATRAELVTLEQPLQRLEYEVREAEKEAEAPIAQAEKLKADAQAKRLAAQRAKAEADEECGGDHPHYESLLLLVPLVPPLIEGDKPRPVSP